MADPRILTWQEVSEWLELQQSDSDKPTLLRLAASVEDQIEKTLSGYKFSNVTYTDQAYDGTGTDSIILPNAPITTLTSIKIGRDSTNPSETLDPTDPDVVVWYDYGLVSRTDGYTFPRKRKYCLFSYKAGWTKDTVSSQMKTALLSTVAYYFRSRGREAVRNELLSGMLNWTGRELDDLPGVKNILAMYQRPTVAAWF